MIVQDEGVADELRKPFLALAVVAIILVIAIEIGAGITLRGVPPTGGAKSAISGALPPAIQEALDDIDDDDVDDLASASSDVEGLGIPYMAVLDGFVLLTVGLMASSVLIQDATQGRLQGCVTGILSLFLIPLSCLMIILGIVFLLFLIALLLSVPFGTIAYLAVFGFFNRGGAAGVLGLLLFLKLAFVVLLLLAQQRFLQNRGLVLLILSSLVCNIVLSFLHGLVPGFLVSITDALGGIIVAVCGLIWWVMALIGAIPAVLRALRPAR